MATLLYAAPALPTSAAPGRFHRMVELAHSTKSVSGMAGSTQLRALKMPPLSCALQPARLVADHSPPHLQRSLGDVAADRRGDAAEPSKSTAAARKNELAPRWMHQAGPSRSRSSDV